MVKNCNSVSKYIKRKERKKNAMFCAAAAKKFSSWMYQIRYYIFSIYSNCYVHHTEISHVGT